MASLGWRRTMERRRPAVETWSAVDGSRSQGATGVLVY
jgi:hypothetical protein